jgi:hypothetical protein
VLLEAILRTGGEHTILVPFDNLELHKNTLRDTITADWLILLDACDPDSLHALDRADFDGLQAAGHIELATLTPPDPAFARDFSSRLPQACPRPDVWRVKRRMREDSQRSVALPGGRRRRSDPREGG